VLLEAVADAFARAALDTAELLDVDVDQLAGTGALVALRGLKAKAPELAHPDARQDRRHRRQRHVQHLGDLRAGHPQPAQRGDRLHAALIGAIGNHGRRRGAVQQPAGSLRPIAPQPLAGGALADSGRLGGPRQRPPRPLDTFDQQLAALQAEPGVSVQLHPVSSLGLVALTPTSLQGGPDEQRD
jgi:hypothetical protein